MSATTIRLIARNAVQSAVVQVERRVQEDLRITRRRIQMHMFDERRRNGVDVLVDQR